MAEQQSTWPPTCNGVLLTRTPEVWCNKQLIQQWCTHTMVLGQSEGVTSHSMFSSMIDPWLTRRSLFTESLKVSLIRPLGMNWTADSLLKSTTSSKNDRTRDFLCTMTAAGAWTTQVFAHRNTILKSNKGKERKEPTAKKNQSRPMMNTWWTRG